MYKKIFLILILQLPFFANAAEIGCSGVVTWVMADHSSCKDDAGKKQLAFKHSSGAYWFCSGSDTASSLVLAAKMSQSALSVYMDNDGGNSTCSVHSHFLKPNYSIIL
jgi:hypothetical protein